MKIRLGIQVMFVIVLVGVLALSAAGADWKIKVNVPFEFEVGNSRLPAGLYTISRVNTNGMLQIVGADGRGMFTQTIPGGESQLNAPRLVFHVFGDRYYLSQVRLSTGYTGQLQPSRAEREYLANSKKPAQVAVVVGQ